MNESHKSLIAVLTCVLICVVLVSPVDAKLPPRPDVTPTAEDSPAGTIILEVSPPRIDLWSVVQWQDAGGGWHNVEGWMGIVEKGKTIWWVDRPHWGTGPFRWVVSEGANGVILGTSASFNLPQSRQTTTVTIALSSQ